MRVTWIECVGVVPSLVVMVNSPRVHYYHCISWDLIATNTGNTKHVIDGVGNILNNLYRPRDLRDAGKCYEMYVYYIIDLLNVTYAMSVNNKTQTKQKLRFIYLRRILCVHNLHLFIAV